MSYMMKTTSQEMRGAQSVVQLRPRPDHIGNRVSGPPPRVHPDDPLQQMVDAMPAQVAVVDQDWCIVAANAAWLESAQRNGLGSLLTIGHNYKRFCQWSLMSGFDDAENVLKGIAAIDEGRIRQYLRTYKAVTDSQYYHISITRFEADGGSYATVSRLNMTELFELRRERLQLSASLMRAQANLVRAQEDERQRVARELHDTAAQYLVGINLGLARLQQASLDPTVAGIAAELSDLLGQFHRDLRGLTYALHPPQLKNAGLQPALRALCTGFGQRSGLDMRLQIYGIERASGSAVESAVYRIVQEALANIHKHAHARHVRVRLCERADTLFVVVADDGVGMRSPLEANQHDAPTLGVGIPGMIARVTELGGRFAVHHGRDGRGTVLSAAIPRNGSGQAFVVDPRLAELQRQDVGTIPGAQRLG